MNIFDVKPELNSYVAKFMDETGCDFKSACDELGINNEEEFEIENLD
ncbi:hypothetical protein [Clostridium chauvoei]|uniref:Uncharacterized protein n=2 Tax=Clostridium chauvoei TaxID=46867 RepID=S6FLZ2_9CLOT|nr:hypothetical protein [Clostridium chauvoei]MBX7281506.1 hypothetical protein [Clostridium chauvoei]MBX7284047.1 hypothetical protein [Clostridium chauvoei]MBX7286554.1 hypothetical protein [Clostridium chauvoei]MBX7289074.1 hypothetical protein [Clostridium chauvoei]MBX7291611.1 hypothetical protein [Clostridium chauvoei]